MKRASCTLSLFIFLVSFSGILAQTPVGAIEIGTNYEMTSNFTDTSYQISVFLPPNYETNKDSIDYPCLYLFIGRDDLFHSATGITRLLSRHREIPQMIIVGVTNIRWWPDLTPEKVDWRDDAGHAEPFLAFVKEQVIPFVDESYSTNDQRIYMGHSLGGLFGVYVLTQDKDLFDDFILISPSVQDRANSLFPTLQEMVQTESFDNDVYFSVGTEGNRMSKGSHRLGAIFSEYQGKNLNWQLDIMPDKDHFTIILPSIVNGLRYVNQDVPVE